MRSHLQRLSQRGEALPFAQNNIVRAKGTLQDLCRFEPQRIVFAVLFLWLCGACPSRTVAMQPELESPAGRVQVGNNSFLLDWAYL